MNHLGDELIKSINDSKWLLDCLGKSWSEMTVGGCKETKSMVIKLTILYFFLFDGYKVEWQ